MKESYSDFLAKIDNYCEENEIPRNLVTVGLVRDSIVVVEMSVPEKHQLAIEQLTSEFESEIRSRENQVTKGD